MTKIRLNWIVGVVFILGWMMASTVRADELPSDGHIPWPFDSNQKVELADGEYYTLTGWVRPNERGGYRLEVDLAEHIWLASVKRAAHPFYDLWELDLKDPSGASLKWEQFIDKKIRFNGVAHGFIRRTNESSAEYTISLKAKVPPLVHLTPAK